MEKEEKILTVQCKLNDRDFEDVFHIYLENERGSDRRIGLVTSIILGMICVLLVILLKNMTFIFYAVGCVIVGIAYYKVPINKKFIATNKLHLGEWRETTFYPHSITSIEIFDQNETNEMDEEEIEEATTTITTNSLVAYENTRGFLFAEGKIVNQFFYVPKRGLTKQELADIRDFAENNCSGGYTLLESGSMLGEEEAPLPAEDDAEAESMTADICNQYYGEKRLKLYDSEGRRVGVNGEELAEYAELHDGEEEAEAEAHTEIMEAPELDIEEAFEHIIAEDAEDDE